MRGRMIAVVVGAVIVAGGAVALFLGGRSGTDPEAPAIGGELSTRTFNAGTVEVSVVPLRIDASGAAFRITLSTHSGDLAIDLAEAASLEVNGVAWSGAAWDGDPPGGHHRQGTLTFPPAGPATGDVRLVIEGLQGPIDATWTIG
jgi:hypothetical protein